MMQYFSNTFKDNIAQVPAIIDDTLLKPFTEVVHGFAGHRRRNAGDFLSIASFNCSIVPGRRARATRKKVKVKGHPATSRGDPRGSG